MRILFVKLSSIGDIVHTIPAAAAVKKALPGSKIYWVAEKGPAEVLQNNPLLEALIEVDTKALRRGNAVLGKTWEAAVGQFRRLRALELDLSIDFQGLFKSSAIARIAGTRKRFGFDRDNLKEPLSRRLLTDPIEIASRQNIVFKNIELAEKALSVFTGDPGFRLDKDRPEFPIAVSDEDSLAADEVAERAGGRFAILNPAGGWVTKLWPAENYGALADRVWEELGLIPVLSSGPGDKRLADAVLGASRSGRIVTASLGLRAFHELSRRAEVYVGGDTGPTHLAVAAGCPVVGIFGPTEWWRNGSVNPDDICVERNDIGCRVDCHRRTCDKWICMDIPVETVFEAVSRRLASAKATG